MIDQDCTFLQILTIESSVQSLSEGLFEFLVLAHLGGEHQVADTSTEVGTREATRPGEKISFTFNPETEGKLD